MCLGTWIADLDVLLGINEVIEPCVLSTACLAKIVLLPANMHKE